MAGAAARRLSAQQPSASSLARNMQPSLQRRGEVNMVSIRTPKSTGRLRVGRARMSRPHRASVQTIPSESYSTADWCERHGHPCGRLIGVQCLCGLVRYDD